MSGDAFIDLFGVRRGSGRPDAPPLPTPWWRWPPPNYARLSEWLDHVAASGYTELVLVYPEHGGRDTFLLRAFPVDRASGYAVLELDPGEASWLEDHWPPALRTARDDDRVIGRLAS